MKFKNVISVSLLTALSLAAVGCGTKTVNPNFDMNQNVTPDVNALAARGQSGDIIPGEFIIKFKKNAKNASTILRSAGATKIKDLGGRTSGVQLVKMSPKNSARTVSNLKRSSSIEFIEPNRIIRLPRVIRDLIDKIRGPQEHSEGDYPNDPQFDKQWHHQNMETEAGWEMANSASAKEVTIAILDTGIDGTHPDLKSLIVPGYDAYGNGKELSDKQGHGTHCAGIASAKVHNGIGVAGVANNTKLMSVKVLTDSGSGTYAAVADGIMWAAKNPKVDVMSMSLGGPSASAAIEDAVKTALNNGKFVTAAMGNSGNGSKSYPAAIDGVYSVGATDSSDKRAYFSQYGTWINISAPGVKIHSTFPTYKSGMPGKDYGAISGTSMATPAVAGLAGLLKGLNPSLNGKKLEAIISSTADDLGSAGFDNYYGAGRINVKKAVAKALGK